MEEENILTPDEGTETETIAPEGETLESGGGEGEPQQPAGETSGPQVDYRKKFSESARENQILNEKIKSLSVRIGDFTKKEVPTEMELRAIHPNWDEMNALEKELSTKNLMFERKLNKVSSTVSQMEDERKWGLELDGFIERSEITDNYPGLKGKEKEFRAFALKPTHKGTSLDVLARAFLYGDTKEEKPKKEGSLVERGSGGPKTPQKPKKGYTPEELALLRKTDPKKWRETVEKGNIDISDL